MKIEQICDFEIRTTRQNILACNAIIGFKRRSMLKKTKTIFKIEHKNKFENIVPPTGMAMTRRPAHVVQHAMLINH